MVNILLLLVGLGLVVLGADWLVNGASSIARRAGISEFVIGLTYRYPYHPWRYHSAGHSRNYRLDVRTWHFALGGRPDAACVLRVSFLLFQIRFERRVFRDAASYAVHHEINSIDPNRTGGTHFRWGLVRG